MGKTVKRLYSQFQPSHYVLDLHPDREVQTFNGSVIIEGQKTGRPSQRLTFHQKDLKITKATVIRHDKTGQHDIPVDRINTHNKFDEVRLHAKEILYPGKYTVTLEFTGRITKPMNGMYPCFFEHDGKQKQLIATQFESHHAREVFPCVDEPEAKATFDLTLITPAGDRVISNTPIKPIKYAKRADGNNVTTFETTPKMSTYLLAFVYGELDYKEAKTRSGVTVRTYATPDNVELTEFALEVAVKCLEFYDEYFDVPYPLEKCDMFALPDFASGAMENWGIITYREQAMLVDPKNSTLANKQYVAMVVAHELAHQWFGNLVTMRWWTDLWLNEGFASWIEYLAVDHIYPEWEMWTQFIVDEQQQAMKLDALEHTHPIEVPVNHPDEIRSIFDAISYSKGASVIHMLHEYLTPVSFRDGLRYYLNRHKYGNTNTVDLWQALEEVSGKPVKKFMHAWTSQPGFPVVKASVEDKNVQLSQKRFFINPLARDKSSETWPVAMIANQSLPLEQFGSKKAEFQQSAAHELKLNQGQSGFYRTAYNSSHIERLGELIKRGKIEPLDRLGILSDMFETAKAGQSDTIDVLHFIENFRNEENYAVWDVISSCLGSIRLIMDDENLRELMKPYTLELISSELKRLGWDRKENETHFDRLLRPIILGLAASADEPTVIKRCRELFIKVTEVEDVKPDLRTTTSRQEIRRGIDIDPDMRGVVFGTIARLGGQEEFEKLVRLYKETNLSEERTTLTAALTGFQQPELIKKALNIVDSPDVRLQDVAYWIAYSFLNRHAKNITWQWVVDHWKWLEKNLGTDLSFFRMPIYVSRVFSDKKFIGTYTEFFEPKLSPALDRSYRQGLEMLQWQSAWKERDFKEIKNFFSKFQ